jgi:hypothetical protein
MSTFEGEPEANARAEQEQFENIKNRSKDSYRYRTRTKKTGKWTDWYGEGRQETLTQCRGFYSSTCS